MQEISIHAQGYASEALQRELAPFVEGSMILRLREPVRYRSVVTDPTVLAGIIQAGSTLAVAILGMIEFRKRAGQLAPRDGDGAKRSGRPIRIIGENGVVIEVPLDASPELVARIVEQVQRIDRPRIHLL